jgi:hypothetical protein
MNTLIIQAIAVLAGLIFGTDENGISIFDRITGVVKRWGEKQVPGAEKRKGAMQDIDALDGFVISEQLTRLGIELAVRLLRLKGG